MPFIQINTNYSFQDTDVFLKSLSAFVADLLEKPEKFVMVSIVQNSDMLFGGSNDQLMYMQLKSIELPLDKTKQFSSALCSFVEEELGIKQSRIYIEYTDASRSMWGWNGTTFER